jgi:hypothetical protein
VAQLQRGQLIDKNEDLTYLMSKWLHSTLQSII